ncbi:unnamed protein product, partial [Rotaria sordida]
THSDKNLIPLDS